VESRLPSFADEIRKCHLKKKTVHSLLNYICSSYLFRSKSYHSDPREAALDLAVNSPADVKVCSDLGALHN